MKTRGIKKFTAALTAIMMMAGLMPANVQAEEAEEETMFITDEAGTQEEPVTEEENEEIVSEEITEEETDNAPEAQISAQEENAEDSLGASESVFYYDENGEAHICSSYTLLSSVADQPGVTIGNGWYVAEGNGWGFNNRVTILGETHIILMDNCGVIFNRGIQNNEAGNLSIWGGPSGNGQMSCIQALNATGGNAGIGGDNSSAGGTFNLHRGMVTAAGQTNGAGVGGGQYCYGGFINIYGGTLNATGGQNAAGIGGGEYGEGGAIRIYGGTVTAAGGAGNAGGAGIGGGEDRSGGDIHIFGGTVIATGGNGNYGAGAGIGGGDEGNGGTITISGGNITARGASWAAGIGGGNCQDGGTITIEGGTVMAFGKGGGAGIGGGDEGNSGSICLNSADVEAHGTRAIGGGEGGNMESIKMANGIGIEGFPYEQRISILHYANDVKLVNMDYAFEPVSYIDENGNTHSCKDYTNMHDVYDREGVTLATGWYVVEGAGWGFNNRLTVTGDVNLILTDNCHLILNRGIRIYGGGSLSIWAGAQGNGRMDCVQAFETSEGKAGIGGDNGESGGTFNLHGGTVNANGQNDAAGIGGGKNGHGGTINVYGGTLNAAGGNNAAGIGGGEYGEGGTIRIYGGNVTAAGGSITINCASVTAEGRLAIGHGYDGEGGTITLGSRIGVSGSSYASRYEVLKKLKSVTLAEFPDEEQPVIYYDDGLPKSCTDYRYLRDISDDEGATLSDGWYITDGTITYNSRVTVAGTVNLILADGSKTEFRRGIQNNSNGHLIIWGQAYGDGILDCTQSLGTSGNAGIGGDKEADGGVVEIHGGIVKAEGRQNAAGIGGGQYGTGGTILIYGGSVTAAGGAGSAGGAGIGGGEDRCGGDIRIYGGTVNATGGNGTFGAGAGIGGGNITATGASWAAGIGGGNKCDGGTIIINGGMVKATGNKGGAGIGGGDEAGCGTITINTADVEAHGTHAIGEGEDGSGGTIALGDHIGVAGYSFIYRYDVLKRLSDAQLKEFQEGGETVTYYDDGVPHTCTEFSYVRDLQDAAGATFTEGWFVAEGVNMFDSRVTILGTVNIILTDSSQTIFKRGILNNTFGHLIIWGQEKGNGELICMDSFGDSKGAGIGGDEGADGGILEIHGGNVKASGAEGAAGIGGGEGGNGGTVRIYGGYVVAGSPEDGAGIGGGNGGNGGTFEMYGGQADVTGAEGAGIGGGLGGNGGTIVVNGGIIVSRMSDSDEHAAAIGGGRYGNAGTVTINGGRMQVYGAHGDGIGRGDEGTGDDSIVINGGDILAMGAHALNSSRLELADCIYAENESPDADRYELCRNSQVWLRTRR